MVECKFLFSSARKIWISVNESCRTFKLIKPLPSQTLTHLDWLWIFSHFKKNNKFNLLRIKIPLNFQQVINFFQWQPKGLDHVWKLVQQVKSNQIFTELFWKESTWAINFNCINMISNFWPRRYLKIKLLRTLE